MAAELNHTIVWASDGARFAATYAPVQSQHYAFLIGEAEFDCVFARVREQGLKYWADPFRKRPSRINHENGGCGIDFVDPDGHQLEVITRPYGAGGGA